MNLGKYTLASYTNSLQNTDGKQKEVRTMNFAPSATQAGAVARPSIGGNLSIAVDDAATWDQFKVGSDYDLLMNPSK